MIVGIGTDIVKIDRMISRREKLAEKVLTDDEKKIYDQCTEMRKPEWLAGRFAAKEAIIKAISKEQKLMLNQISVLVGKNSEPICDLSGYQVFISIAHEKDYAIAYAQILKE